MVIVLLGLGVFRGRVAQNIEHCIRMQGSRVGIPLRPVQVIKAPLEAVTSSEAVQLNASDRDKPMQPHCSRSPNEGQLQWQTDNSPNAKLKHFRSPLQPNSHARAKYGSFHRKRATVNTKSIQIPKRQHAHARTSSLETLAANRCSRLSTCCDVNRLRMVARL